MSIKRSISKIKLQNVALLVLIAFAILGLTYFLSKNPQIINLNNSFLRGFLGEGRNEASLKNKHKTYIALIKEQKYDEVYDKFLAETEKEKTSREKYINDGIDSWKELKERGIENADSVINKVIVRDNFGFVDTTSMLCSDINCNDIKKSFRRYSVWVYLNNRWYKTSKQPLCIRDSPYEKPAEFDRAISLIDQRLQLAAGLKEKSNNFYNCLDIQYEDLGDVGAEGIFYFDPEISSLERLVIKVDNAYVYYDDLLTASLLAHEMVHAEQFISEFALGQTGQTCVGKEVEAYGRQIDLLINLNQEEKNSISSRINLGQVNNQLFSLKQLNNDVLGSAMNSCGVPDNAVLSQGDTNCLSKNINYILTTIISDNSYYQQQCNL